MGAMLCLIQTGRNDGLNVGGEYIPRSEVDGSKPIQYGVIAEEVEKVMPDLVVVDGER